MKQRVADYIADFLVEKGITQCFTVTGGGAMHLNDAFGHHPVLSCVYNHHEQACTIAAEGYYRSHGVPALACVTTGPGGTNAITGVLGAWLDSIPMLIISGQVKYETTVRSTGITNLRQLGDQEYDITPCVSSMTKYSVMITNPEEIRYHLEKALFLALSGKCGPVWLDIPQNVQSAIIETDNLSPFSPELEQLNTVPKISDNELTAIVDKLRTASRPLIYAGMGVHLSKSEDKLIELAEKLQIPVVCGFSAHDIFYYDHPLYVGRPGTIGDRAANFAVQNADLLLIIGCRLNIRQIGYNFASFAPVAYKIMVDIDKAELQKPTLHIDLPVQCDAADFLEAIIDRVDSFKPDIKDWVSWCIERKEKYPVCLPEYYNCDKINPYCFMDMIGKILPEGQKMVATNATACICSFQAINLKKHQRIFSNSGSAPMGYGLPAAIGASVGQKEDIICFEGDGSLQMNLQELATVAGNDLPIKIFVLNNGGYHSIRQTQTNFFGGKLVGCNDGEGIFFPKLDMIAKAYSLPYFICRKSGEMKDIINKVLNTSGPVLCEVVLTKEQPFAPRSASRKLENGKMISRPLHDLAPFLPRDEYESNLLPSLKEWDKVYMENQDK